MSTAFHFDKEKYLQIFKTDGASQALTTLHNDIREWEHQAFEGEKGYQPEMWKKIIDVRNFSRELWELALQQSAPTSKNTSQ